MSPTTVLENIKCQSCPQSVDNGVYTLLITSTLFQASLKMVEKYRWFIICLKTRCSGKMHTCTGWGTKERTTSAICRSPSWTMWPTSTASCSCLPSLLAPPPLVSTTLGAWAGILGNLRKKSTQLLSPTFHLCFLLCFFLASSCPTSTAMPWGTFNFLLFGQFLLKTHRSEQF